jgi:hypothetical protein
MGEQTVNLARLSFRKYAAWVLVLYLVVSAFGMTTSHTGQIFGATQERSVHLLGSPRPERSDEFLRGSPRVIASLRGIDLSSYTPFDVTGSSTYEDATNGLLEAVVRWTRPPNELLTDEIARRLPLQVGFSLLWWSSTILLLLVLPLWFRQLGLNAGVGVVCGVLIFLTPTNSWFSYLPSFLVANAVASACCFLLISELHHRRWFKGWRWIIFILVAIYCGRYALTVIQYPPWGVPTAALVLLVTGTFFVRRDFNRQWVIYGASILVAGVGAMLVIRLNQNLFSVALDTVYPGKRRSIGGSGESQPFGGPISWFMQTNFAREQGKTNPELAWGPLFLVFPTLALLLKNQQDESESAKRTAIATALSLLVVLTILFWSQVEWPRFLLNWNPLALVPSGRAAQISGVLAVLPLCVIMTQKFVRPANFRSSGVGITAVFAIATAVFVSKDTEWLRVNYFTGSGVLVTWLSLAVTVILTIALINWNSRFSLIALAGAMLLSSVGVNPVTLGLGAFNHSNAVSRVLELSSRDNGRWATTGFYEDALIISTGVPQLSGQQPYGPNREAWEILDPESRFEEFWNRGQSYVNFAWDARAEWTIWNPSPDVIQIVIDPCRSELKQLNLRWIVSINPISFPCISESHQVTWMGNTLNIYGLN